MEAGEKEILMKYSIKDLEQLSGIKAHTLRIWEQRYNIIKPIRSETNIRAYSNYDLRMLLNISMLNNNGFKISKIAEMSEREIFDTVVKISKSDFDSSTQIDNLVISMVDLDEIRFEEAITNNIQNLGFDSTINNIIYPFLKKIAIMWITGSVNPAQEHFISNLIRQKLIVAIDSQKPVTNSLKDSFTLFLAEDELHEISLLYYHYCLRGLNIKSYYLGQSVPMEDLKKVHNFNKAKFLLSVFTKSMAQPPLQVYLNNLSKTFIDSTIFVSGYQFGINEIKLPTNVLLFKDQKELISMVNVL